MRNTTHVLIDQPGCHFAIGVDRSDTDAAHFVRLDVNGTTFFMGPKHARKLADLLRLYASQTIGGDDAGRD
jgi:hypothetical protein